MGEPALRPSVVDRLKTIWHRFTPFAASEEKLSERPGAVGRFPFRRLEAGKNEFVIIGLGRFGTSVAKTLISYGRDVLAIDIDRERVQSLSTELPHVMQLDATNIEALRQAGVGEFETGLVCIGTDFESNLLATVLLQRLGVKKVITKARTQTQQEILRRIGADEVILPEHEAGVRLGRKLASGYFLDYLEVSSDVGVIELVAPPSLWHRTLAESNLRQRFGLSVVAVRRGSDLLISPSANFRMEQDDVLVVLGRIEDADRLRR